MNDNTEIGIGGLSSDFGWDSWSKLHTDILFEWTGRIGFEGLSYNNNNNNNNFTTLL